ANVGGGVVRHLAAQGVVAAWRAGLLVRRSAGSTYGHGRGGAKIARRGHGGNMTCVENKGACACGTRATRTHKACYRYWRFQDVADDGTHRAVQAARCVDLENHQYRAVLLRRLHSSAYEVGHCGADRAVQLEHRYQAARSR